MNQVDTKRIVEMQGIRRHYGDGVSQVKALDDVDLSIQEHQGAGRAHCSKYWVVLIERIAANICWLEKMYYHCQRKS